MSGRLYVRVVAGAAQSRITSDDRVAFVVFEELDAAL
jgi:hypothetical protein